MTGRALSTWSSHDAVAFLRRHYDPHLTTGDLDRVATVDESKRNDCFVMSRIDGLSLRQGGPRILRQTKPGARGMDISAIRLLGQHCVAYRHPRLVLFDPGCPSSLPPSNTAPSTCGPSTWPWQAVDGAGSGAGHQHPSQAERLADHCREVAEEWTPTVLIHRDLKLDNRIVGDCADAPLGTSGSWIGKSRRSATRAGTPPPSSPSTYWSAPPAHSGASLRSRSGRRLCRFTRARPSTAVDLCRFLPRGKIHGCQRAG